MSIQENTRELQVVLEQANSLPTATTAVEIVQETGDSTVAVMSQKAVTDAIPTAVEAALTEAKASGEFDGADGVSITITDTTESTADGGYNSVEFSDGTILRIRNGSRGSTGVGNDGADGRTPVRGTDYWTEADKAEIKSYVDESILGGAW